MFNKLVKTGFAVLASVFFHASSAAAQTAAQPMITAPISDSALTRLAGNTRPEANSANDRGKVADSLSMPHMLLQLSRPAAQEQALTQLIDQLHDPASPNYHQWLNAAQFGAQFGPASSDIKKITGWLTSKGFTVNTVYPSGMVIDFSGTAGQVTAAFHTEIHNLLVKGVKHIANMSDPLIPTALAPAVVGPASLNDFKPNTGPVRKNASQYTPGDGTYLVTPPDLATIYNFNPIFTGGNTGQNQTIYLIEDSDLYTNADWTTFRATFGLSGYTGASLNTINPAPPSGPTNCADPGSDNGAAIEATLDAEYASAAAPSAAIVMVTCADTLTTFGGLLALQNLINGTSSPAIISMSYGVCEAFSGSALNAAFYSIYQQGVTQGASIYVSSGDQLAAVCDRGDAVATFGIGVNGWGSTPYNVAVGGTDFADTFANDNSDYWSSTNTSTYGSALSYIPEIPWNQSCASGPIASVLGFPTTYGASGLCSSALANDYGLLEIVGGSGGPSACATGTPTIFGVVSGTCAGWSKPSWQAGVVGIVNDGVRDLPDVSLFASVGPWNHAYAFCYSDVSNGGSPCVGTPNNWTEAGGTSFASPIFAGIQALVNEKTGSKQGNPNYRLYQLAASQYAASNAGACNSNNGATSDAACIFHDVTLGDIDAPCTGTYNCYLPSGGYGVLSTSDSAFLPAYGTTKGWDFATGLGSVNVANLVSNWTTTSQHWSVAGIGDFNHDGYADILWRGSDGSVAIWLMKGGSVLSGFTVGVVASNWSIAGVGDFNNDGTSDILWRGADGSVAIWLMSTTTPGAILSAGTIGSASTTTWSIAGVGKFYGGSSASDILWRGADGSVAIWQMNGLTIQSAYTVGTAPTTWSVAGVGDFNGDKTSDILWRNLDGTVAVWLMSSGGYSSGVTVGQPDNSWSVAGVQDYNSDGKADILWRNADGTVALWFMNGGAIASASTVGLVQNAWAIVGVGSFDGVSGDVLWRNANETMEIWFMNNSGGIASSAGLGTVP